MSEGPSIVWLRNDLRLADNPALHAAQSTGREVLVVYVLDQESDGCRPLGSATKWWLHESLVSLGRDLEKLGNRLVLLRGAGPRVIQDLAIRIGASAVFWNRRYGSARAGDAALKEKLKSANIVCRSFQANLLFEPWNVQNGEGKAFRVFTPFWRAATSGGVPRSVLPTVTKLPPFREVAGDDLGTWNLVPPSQSWTQKFQEIWSPGEAGAHSRLDGFIESTLRNYHRRDEPGPVTTSRLSPHLRFGELSPNQVWSALDRPLPDEAQKNKVKFLSEIGWREFSYNILFNFTELARKNFRSEFDHFPWEEPEKYVMDAWKKGVTGIPLVDAGMRELWSTGYMHNRVRMVVASFLIKNLLIDWRAGEAWFWDTLVDADEANNPASWQWVAGSGADAAPYFRVFNPLLQAEKFDPEQEYVRRWVPELDTKDYPQQPIVDLKVSRNRALEAFDVLKASRQLS